MIIGDNVAIRGDNNARAGRGTVGATATAPKVEIATLVRFYIHNRRRDGLCCGNEIRRSRRKKYSVVIAICRRFFSKLVYFAGTVSLIITLLWCLKKAVNKNSKQGAHHGACYQ